MTSRAGRKWIVIVATMLVVIYCIALLVYAEASPDIGLRCSFYPKVGRVYPRYLRALNDEPIPDPVNLVGATIRQVGPNRVENLPQFLRALRDLRAHSPTDGSAPSFIRRGGEDWVQVVLEREIAGEQFKVWCVLGQTPLESTLPALLWLALEVGLFVVGGLVFWKRPD